MKKWRLSRRVFFEIDTWDWYLFPTVRLNLVGCDHRIYNILIHVLCFHLIIDIDEDSIAD